MQERTTPGVPTGPQIGRIRGQLEDIHTLLGAYWASGMVIDGGDGPLESAATNVQGAIHALSSLLATINKPKGA